MKRKLNTGDPYDFVIPLGQQFSFIWGYGQLSPDENTGGYAQHDTGANGFKKDLVLGSWAQKAIVSGMAAVVASLIYLIY